MHGGDWRQTFSEGQVLQAKHDQKILKVFGVYEQTAFVVISSLPQSFGMYLPMFDSRI